MNAVDRPGLRDGAGTAFDFRLGKRVFQELAKGTGFVIETASEERVGWVRGRDLDSLDGFNRQRVGLIGGQHAVRMIAALVGVVSSA